MIKYILGTLFLISLICPASAQGAPDVSSLITLPGNYQNAAEEDGVLATQAGLTKISDPLLKDIISKVLRYNSTLNKMAAAFDLLNAEYAVIRSNRSFSAELDMQEGVFGSKGQAEDYYILSVPVSFELDAWGRLRAQRQAAFADVNVAQEDLMALRLTLIAETMEAYYRGLYLSEQIRIHKQAVSIAEEIKNIKKKQYGFGLFTKDVFWRSEKELKEFSAAQADIEAQRIRIEHTLKIMMGEYPAAGWLSGEFILPEYLTNVAAGLPSELIEHRPDIRAQQSRLAAAGFRTEVAKRDLYPQITLAASGVKSSEETRQLINGVIGSWNGSARVSIPLWDGGRKTSEVKVEQSRYQQELEDYKNILLQAFKEVEDALAQGNKQARIVRELKEYEDSLQNVYDFSQARVRQGLDSALVAKERLLELIRVQLERTKAEFQLISQRIQLLRALGGGWQ